MNQYYAIEKSTQKIAYQSASLFLLKDIIKYDKKEHR